MGTKIVLWGPKRRRLVKDGKKSWGMYYVRFMNPSTGKPTSRSLGTKDRDEAMRQMAKVREELERQFSVGGAGAHRIRVDALYGLYRELFEAEMSSGTMHGNLTVCRQLGEYAKLHGREFMDEFVPADGQQLKSWLSTLVSKRTANIYLTKLRTMLSRLRKMKKYRLVDFLEEVPNYSQRQAEEEVEDVVWLDKAQLTRGLQAAAAVSEDWLKYWALLGLQGLRRTEGMHCRLCWIVWPRGEWSNSDTGWIHVPKKDLEFRCKTRRARRVPLTPEFVELVRPLCGQLDREDYVCFPDAQSHLVYRRFSMVAFDEICLAANLPEGFTPKGLRHTFASQAVINGVDLYRVSKWLGHSDMKMTQVYAHLLPVDGNTGKVFNGLSMNLGDEKGATSDECDSAGDRVPGAGALRAGVVVPLDDVGPVHSGACAAAL